MLNEFLSDVILQTVLITFFVLSMIMVLEYINVLTQGHVNDFMHKHSSLQIIISSILGLLPGCIGSFTAVSLYTHDVVGFGALMSNLIATTGDEAFFMVSLMPDKAWLIFLVLLVLSVVVGYSINLIAKRHPMPSGNQMHFMLHKAHDHAPQPVGGNFVENFKHLSVKRIVLIASIILFIVMTALGFFEEHHHEAAEHAEEAEEGLLSPMSITFFVLSLVSLFVVVTVNNHFLEDHIWHHVIGKHFAKVAIWTFVALLAIFVLTNFVALDDWISSFNKQNVEIVLLLVAILIGLIPESGPHIVFITLYCSGVVPFGVLLANCIVQDGHGAIPLFAESKKDFFIVKGIKAGLALLIGLVMILF